jgi:IS1 family transposase
MVNMNRLTTAERARVIGALVEGNSIRATVRMTGVAKNTIAKLLVDLGSACYEYQNDNLRDLYSRYVQCDEIWSFCYSKAKNVPAEHRDQFGYGDVWTWTAIDAESKLAICWLVGERSPQCALAFMDDLASRLRQRIQITSDGFKPYREAVRVAFGNNVDFAQLIKEYGKDPREPDTRYSPAKCLGTEKKEIIGWPDRKHISTSFVERQNLTMRMSMRRFTRLTNAFSKKVQNLDAAVSLHFMYYNFARVHQTLGMTPAMAAGVSDHAWTLEEIASLLD